MTAQISLSYSEIEEPAQNVSAPVVSNGSPATASGNLEKNQGDILKYGWVDIFFLSKAIEPLVEFSKSYDQQFIEKQHELGAAGWSKETQEEFEKWYDSLTREFWVNVQDFIMGPATELGYIPLDKQRSNFASEKLMQIPDITWELSKKMKGMQLSPFSNKLNTRVNLKLAFFNPQLVIDDMSPYLQYGHMKISNLVHEIPNYRENLTEERRVQVAVKFRDEAAGLYEKFMQKVIDHAYNKAISMGYDAVLIVENDPRKLHPSIIELMDDISYPLIQDMPSLIENDYNINRYIHICREFESGNY